MIDVNGYYPFRRRNVISLRNRRSERVPTTDGGKCRGLTAMREWLDHYRFEPTMFRHTFTETGLLFQVYFDFETEAKMFAQVFGGREEKSGIDNRSAAFSASRSDSEPR